MSEAGLTRRFFLRAGAAVAAGCSLNELRGAESRSPELAAAIDKIDSYITLGENFRDVSRGKPVPHSLPEARRKEVGLTRETWKLDKAFEPQGDRKDADAAHRQWREAVERAKGWA